MMHTEQQHELPRPTARVIPALIHIEDPEPRLIATAEDPRRRITVLLDYPLIRQLGWFSWWLALVAVAATPKAAAIPVSAIVVCGLIVGLINAARWLFARRR